MANQVGVVRWAVWLDADMARRDFTGYDKHSQWVKDSNGIIPLFPSPEKALDWCESWQKRKENMKYYEAKEFAREVKDT
jgi:hypothetical protein